MKACMFHLMSYRDPPPDYEQRYNSAFIDPLWLPIPRRPQPLSVSL